MKISPPHLLLQQPPHPTPPNAPSKTTSTNQTSSSQENTSSSFHSKLQISPPSSHEPTSPHLLNLLLDNISDVPPRPLNPQPLQSHPSLDITLFCPQSLLLITFMTLHHHHLNHNLNNLSWVILFSTTIMTIMSQLAFVVLEGNSAMENLVVAYGNLNIVMENPNHLNEPNEAIPEVNPVVPEPNQVVDIHDPNEMVDILDDIDLVDYDNEDPEEDPEEEPEEEPEEDVEIELDNDAELYFLMMWRVTKTRHLEMCHLILCHPILSQRTRRLMLHPRLLLGLLPKSLMPLVPSREVYLRWVSHLLLVTHLIIDDLAPWALRRDLEASRARAREMDAKELLNHDLENVERALGNVLERVSVLESEENAILKKKLVETETKLEWAHMERDMAERRLHVSQGWNKIFYLNMVRIGAVPKPPSDDEDTECPRKKLKNSTSDGTKGPSESRGPPSDS
ncbi:hypothetical protein Tco_1533527 [Tanacetum coccineum]